MKESNYVRPHLESLEERIAPDGTTTLITPQPFSFANFLVGYIQSNMAALVASGNSLNNLYVPLAIALTQENPENGFRLGFLLANFEANLNLLAAINTGLVNFLNGPVPK